MNTLFQNITKTDKNTDNNVVKLPRHAKMTQSVHIKDLELMMSIGVLPEEQRKKQRVLVSLILDVKPDVATGATDNIDHVVCYAGVIDAVQQIAQAGHINLVETFAEKIIAHCLGYNTVKKVAIDVSKPDTLLPCAAVGCTMTVSK